MHPDLARLFDGAPLRSLPARGQLFARGDRAAAMYLVETGLVALQRNSPGGQLLVLHKAGPGEIVAEAMAYSRHCHCDAVALRASAVRVLARARFLGALQAAPQLAHLWAAHLAHAVQEARLKGEIRTLRTVAERLDAWLAAGHDLPPQGQLQTLAAEIGVSREALYRELARRR